MTQRDTVIHLVAGGVAGTVGAIVTCPLEVVKTRLQSSSSGFHVEVPKIAAEGHNTTQVTCKTVPPEHKRRICTASLQRGSQAQVMTFSGYGLHTSKSMNLVQCLRHIVKYEGTAALFKGLGPNLVGVAPSRAIYFCTYSQAKHFFNNSILPPDTPIVHVCSASAAGFVACTATNPIWFVKTRLQLDHTRFGHMTAAQCIRKIYAQTGIRGFYKGITASYMGISETVIHFVIYEAVKAKLIEHRHSISHSNVDSRSSKDFLEFMMAGAISKTVASCIAYPHEVARTRLREEGNKYNAFWQTLFLVWREEGVRGVYRGLSTQLVRQIPNTAIMMATYEAVVYMLTTHFTSDFYTESENS